jgi:hypothetical protein
VARVGAYPVAPFCMKWDAKEIHHLRLKLGWSSAEFARAMGSPVISVRAWEAGTEAPHAEACRRLGYFSAFVEQNANRIVQVPAAEFLMDRDGLNQITRDQIEIL